MKRRDFFKGSSAAILASTLFSPFESLARSTRIKKGNFQQAKNIIFLVSDGMSSGTLNMADLLSRRKFGRASNWVSLYEQGEVRRAMMDTASANSLVTDSAAASSSWGGGRRVNNGAINTNPDGSQNTPIWKKFKNAGKSAGCVTTVPITHATPAGFCVTSSKRDDQAGIAIKYLEAGYDVLLGGGDEFFNPVLRKDKKDVYELYRNSGYKVVDNKNTLGDIKSGNAKGVLGVFHGDGLPYSVDANSDSKISNSIPTLAEMTEKAIELLSMNEKGFVLQVEGGKVDWAAHANDIGALLYDQLAFDDAIKVAMAFAKSNKETLVIITTDHGNANPGLCSGSNADRNFDRLHNFKQSNEWILQGVNKGTTSASLIDKIEAAQGYAISPQEAKQLLSHFSNLSDQGLYNPEKLPYRELAAIQSRYTSVGWASMDHTADYVELTMMGPGSDQLPTFIKNYELHNLMLRATGLG